MIFEGDIQPEFDVTKLLDMECGKTDVYLLEIKSYLREPTTHDLHSLDKYPEMKKVFLKFNCLMTSEADCERIFSYAGMFVSLLIAFVFFFQFIFGFDEYFESKFGISRCSDYIEPKTASDER